MKVDPLPESSQNLGALSESNSAPCKHGRDWGSGIAVSVLILNWNGKAFLKPCLSSVFDDACRHVEVVLVDNGSTDGSVEFAKQKFPNVRTIGLTENLGFCQAYNTAVRQVSARFVVFLNNDTVVERGWLAPLIDVLMHEAGVGITTSKVLFSGTRVINAAGGQLKLWQGASELGFGYNEAFLSGKSRIEPFYASGSAMAIERERFLQIGGFDPVLWAYAEDLDLSWRARLAGYTVRYVPESVVNHHYSGYWGVFNPRKHLLGTTNTLAVMLKCLSIGNLIHSIPAYVMFAFAKGLGLAVLERDAAYLTNVAVSIARTARTIRTLRTRRRETQSLRVRPDRQLLKSEGFGLFDWPWTYMRVLKRAQHLRDRVPVAEATS